MGNLSVSKNQTLPQTISQPPKINSLEPYEQKILEVKYASFPFGKKSVEELEFSAMALLIKLNVITGWNFPTEPEHQQILTDQFAKLLIEKYPNVNPDEVEYAFRNYHVKDWGKNMNLSLIQEVMEPYLSKRFEISRIEEQQKPKLPAPQEPEMPDAEFIEMNRNIYKGSKLWGLISERCYGLLKLNLSEDEKEVIRKKARAHFFSSENKDNIKGLRYDQHENYININCKKLAVAFYFDSIQNL